MQSKALILSDLVATRNIIKSKFKRAYSDRMKRERTMKELLKPVTSAITTLKPTPEKKKDIKNTQPNKTDFEKTVSLSSSDTDDEDESANFEQARSSNSFDITEDNSSPNQSPKHSKQLSPSMPKSTSTPKTKQRSNPLKKSNKKKKKYTYEVEYDNQDIKHYDETPDDDLDVFVTRTNKTSGEMTPASMKWRKIPTNSRQQWLLDRKRIHKFVKSPQGSILSKKIRRQMEATVRSPYSTTDDEDKTLTRMHTRSSKKKKGQGVKTYNDSIDFNFIPYNVNNHIIYEYFDDPNELCDRLRLLVSSRMAGNTNHMQEINSIVEELRELKCIV